MGFMITYFVMALSCILITGRTLVAYVDCALWLKTAVYVLLCFAWFSPILIWNLQSKAEIPVWLYGIFAKVGYFLLGFAFLLVMILIIRDFLWMIIYWLSGKNIISPNDFRALNFANIVTICILSLCCLYGVYKAEQLPQVWHYTHRDKRILKPLRLLVAADMHITKMTPVKVVKRWVEHLNKQNADIILLPGDIADDRVADIKQQIEVLKSLKAPLGIYYILGNHEIYFGGPEWEAEFASLGWIVLHNSGIKVENSGVYIAGVPDISGFSISSGQALRRATESDYRILLSHGPAVIKKISANRVDLQVSGHTHGGQIFPFNIFTKLGNSGFVSGEYKDGITTLLVTKGVGYWGPPIRLGAESDIILIELKPYEGDF